MTDLETALREQIRLAVNAQVALDVVTDHCHSILEKFRNDLDEEVPVPPILISSMGRLDIDAQLTQLPAVRPGSEVPFLGVVVPTNTPIDLPSLGVQYEGDTLMNNGHTAVIRYE